MAEASISPLLVNPAPAPQASSTQAQPKADEGAPKFYQVLKERSANSSDKTAAKNSSKAPEAPSSKASASSESATATPEETASTEGSATLMLLLDLPGRMSAKDKTQPEDGSASDSSVAGITDPALLNAPTDPAAAAAALAANTAKLAGNAERSGREEQTLSEQTLNLADQADRGAKRESMGAEALQQDLQSEAVSNALAGERSTKPAHAEADKSFATTLAAAQNQAASAAHQTQMAAEQPAQNTAPVARHEVATPVGSRDWAEDVSQKVSWVATRDNGRAELVLNPAHLGRIEVSINLNGEHATAAFVAANATAREALQDAMPRLREVLAQSGIQLGQASVDAGTSGQAQAQQQQSSRSNTAFSRYTGQSLPDPVISSGSRSMMSSGNRMIDTFA